MPTLSRGMWDLLPCPGIKRGPPALGAWSLSHWTTWEVLEKFIAYNQRAEFPNFSLNKCIAQIRASDPWRHSHGRGLESLLQGGSWASSWDTERRPRHHH